jgi:purine-nucleoside phosphorylase
MSSIPEVIVARHAGMAVLGLSAISNINDPDDFQPIALDDIIAAAGLIGPQIADLITAIMNRENSLSTT